MNKATMLTPEELDLLAHLPINSLNELLKAASLKNDKNLIKYLLTSEKLTTHAEVDYDDNFCLLNACWLGDIEMVEFLLAYPLLEKHADVTARECSALRIACAGRHMEVIQYLLTSPETKDKIDINANVGAALRTSVYKNYDEITDYLLKSGDFEKHADMHIGSNYALCYAIQNQNYPLIKYILENVRDQDIFFDIVELIRDEEKEINKNSNSSIFYKKDEWRNSLSAKTNLNDPDRKRLLDVDKEYFPSKHKENQVMETLEKVIFEYDLINTMQLNEVLEKTASNEVVDDDPDSFLVSDTISQKEIAKLMISMLKVKDLNKNLSPNIKKTDIKNRKV